MAANLYLLALPAFSPKHGLMDVEWGVYQTDIYGAKHNQVAEAKKPWYTESFEMIAEKTQLDMSPPLLGETPVRPPSCLYLLFFTHRKFTFSQKLTNTPQVEILAAQPHLGFREIYDAGLAAGNGTEEEKATAGTMLETWKEVHERLQVDLRRLSARGRYRLLGCGHDAHVCEPGEVVESMVWVRGGGV